MTSAVTPMASETVRARIDELVELWREFPRDSTTAAVRGAPVIPVTVFGLTAHTFKLAAAVRVLDEAGCAPAYVPLVRQMIECAVTAAWVEASGRRAALKLIHEDARNRTEMFKTFVRAGQHDDGAVAEWEASRDALKLDADTPGARFYERCNEIEGMEGSYGFYRGLSLISHADGMVVDLYCRAIDPALNDPVGVAITTTPDEWAPGTVLGLALTHLLLAGMAWDRIDRRHPLRSRLKEMAAELGMGLKWTQSAAGLKQQRKWERTQQQRRRPTAKGRPR